MEKIYNNQDYTYTVFFKLVWGHQVPLMNFFEAQFANFGAFLPLGTPNQYLLP